MLAPNVKTVAVILVMIVPFVCAYVDKAGSNAGFIRCPDGRRCEDRKTCCYYARLRRYACCNSPFANCCHGSMDGKCCPYFYRCDQATRRCVQPRFPSLNNKTSIRLDATEIRSCERELLPDQRLAFE
ncbi:unnamed protein product [Porites evermanni]|uniref:Granulins domain-containing protein n=1 Tax=Porites evermanni TaxID=104178 RepID=A0ABN8LNT8_9CNID|nr:unnamed protein product [Porites evermanni]